MIRRLDDKPNAGGSLERKAIKTVPAAEELRERIRNSARTVAAGISRTRPPNRSDLERMAGTLLSQLDLAREYFGFTMVAINNEFWNAQFAATPFSRRILLLPHCLRKASVCKGKYSTLGLDCASCGACHIADLKRDAESLGYRVLVAEGTPAVVKIVLSGKADAILGVACLDSLEKAFGRVVELGIPHVAIPLLIDGCLETTAELDHIRELIRLHASRVEDRTQSYVYLLRSAERLFEPGTLDALLAGEIQPRGDRDAGALDPMRGTETIAIDWLRTGGKRFRPFVTLASYAAKTMGEAALRSDADLRDAFPEVVQRAALAVEALHKASLVHDDIEDDDAYRYGQETLHRRYGTATAVNVGDYLIGLGYRLVASGADELGPDCASDMIAMLARSHVRLCRGQGAELLWRDGDLLALRPLEVLRIYALKTAPAFEAAMFIGLRAAGPAAGWVDRLDSYSRCLGVAYQVLNDLKDWKQDGHDKLVAGQDMLSARPTVLLAFALEAGSPEQNRALIELLHSRGDEQQRMEQLRAIYEARGVFAKAEALVDKYSQRATAAAAGVEPPALRQLMHFIVNVLLR